MHSCRQTKERLVDLLFGELAEPQRQQALAEISACPTCSEQYQTLQMTLVTFAQAADTMEPVESYWQGYEARLRARLAEPVRRERTFISGWLINLLPRPVYAVALAAGLLLLIVSSVMWGFRQPEPTDNPVAQVTPAPQSSQVEKKAEAPVKQPVDPVRKEQHPERIALLPRNQRGSRKAKMPPPEAPQQHEIVMDVPNYAATQLPDPALLLVNSPAQHFEQAQMILRSFRNARPETDGSSFDLVYEKQQSRKLIYDNILLRRMAEAHRNLPVEDALTSLEPLLLDIANLPDHPSADDVKLIRERIQKQEIIATLSIISSGTDRMNLTGQANP